MDLVVVEATWPHEAVRRAVDALRPLADPTRAPQMAAYMKHVAPFLGIQAKERRQALRQAWRGLAAPTSDALGSAARRLMAQPERELHYAAYDLIARYLDAADASFLGDHVEDLLTTVPWWDTVDGLGTAAVSPRSRREDATDVIERWSASGDTWLIRAAIQHQRGWREDTEVARVLDLCDRHWASREFFVAKAIGWALRDLAALDPAEVEGFIDSHPDRNTVALREARRGLERSRR
jgi:3-methyladenine DNA glycosylase AlkD